MKKFIAAALCLCSTTFLMSQNADTSKWELGGLVGLNMSQVGLTNWNGGGESSMSATGILQLFAHKKTEKYAFENFLNAAYGVQKTESLGVRKTDDKLDFTSKYGRVINDNWSYTSLLNFKTQFQPGYQFPNDSTRNKISNFLAPGYLQVSTGFENTSIKGVSIYISPVTAKFTIVNDEQLSNQGAFGVDSSKTVRSEFGGSVRIGVKVEPMKNVTYSSTLELFSNYSMNPQNIDVNWDQLLSFKVNKFINASISATLIYDHDIKLPIDSNDDGVVDSQGPRTQFKEVISIGLQYNIQ